MRKSELKKGVLICALLCASFPSLVLAAENKKADPKAKKAEAEAPPAPYDRICHVDVSYIWKAKAGTSTGSTPVMAKEYFASVSEQGFVPEEIQERLKTKLTSVRAQALRTCNEDHQDEAGCIAKKLTGLSSEFPRFDFGRRKMILDSVREDCGGNEGQCVATEVSEMKCWMNVPPETVVPNEPKVEIAQPGNTEPPVSGMGEEETADAESEETESVEEVDTEASGTVAPDEKARPAKKKKKKKAEDPAKAGEGKGKGGAGAEKEPENPFSQPFAIP